jgi:2',3'-cyclic-nucleotide 2'-phosphodiesterase (5'-nucleotidase family)
MMRRYLLRPLTLLLLACALTGVASAAPVTVRILHVNDFHGFANPVLMPGEKVPRGGAARLAARVKLLRGEKPSLLLAAGDMMAGDPWANLFQGESAVALMNRIGFDAMTLGNHEFDFGRDLLARRIAEARFPVLGANVEGMAGLHPYVIREVAGLRVAIAGLVTDDTPVTSHPRNTVGLTFRSPLATAARLIAELRPRIDLIILLTHIGFSADRALAERLPGPLVIVGGHSHTRVEEPVRIGESVVVQAGEHGQAVGVLDVTVEDGRLIAASGRLDEIRADSGTEDPEAARLVETYNARMAAALNETVGETTVDLVAAGVRQRETNFGDLVAEVMRRASGAEAALINAGSIRTGIGRGPIRLRDLASALPFPNHLVTLKITGRDLRQALEHGVSAVETGEGRFPQVAGVRFAFAPTAPAGKRLREVEVAGRPLEDDRLYRVVTTDFLAAGGDGYRALVQTAGGGETAEPGELLRELVADYLRDRKNIAPALDGRIREVP